MAVLKRILEVFGFAITVIKFTARDQYYKTVWTDVKLQQDFDALNEMLCEFSSGHICACS